MDSLASLALICCLVTLSLSQQNTGSSVSPLLIKCYNNSVILERDNRLPATIGTLIALIRKLEDNIPFSSNRELASQILFSFRQDGITKSRRGGLPSEYGIPYSPKEWNSFKNIVILRRVIPRVSGLDTSLLTDLEQCSLHFLLSKSIDYTNRGDEEIVCNQLGKYRMRQVRALRPSEVEQFNVDSDMSSACPVELGVVSSKWGAISAGNLLAGIASGFNKQTIPVNGTSKALDSIFAATIVGDLAESALYQISKTAGQIKIGAEGNWNCTLEPKWYFVKSNQFLQMTDAEIRGGLDGLYLGLSMDNIKRQYADIKTSQILDLYYSRRGVFNNSLKACNRKTLETSFTTSQKLIEQTSYFEALLDPVATLDSSIDPTKFKDLAELAVNSFNRYLPQNLNDPVCSGDNSTIKRISSDMIIFVDMGYDYRRVQPLLSYFFDNIDVNRFETKYSIVNAKTGQTLINSSTTILDYHQMFNQSTQNTMEQGTDFNLILQMIESLTIWKLNNKTNAGSSSLVYTIITKDNPSQYQPDSVTPIIDDMKRKYPDIRILVLGVGQKMDYKNIVINTDSDVFIMPDTSNSNSIGSEAQLKTVITEIIMRVRELPRSIINPNCGANFNFTDKSTFTLVQYVEPNGENVYKLSTNYFFDHGDDATLKIRGQGYGSLSVCISRWTNSDNTGNTSLNCQTINNDEFSNNIKDYCDGSFSDCNPVIISVLGGTSYYKCNDRDCRFPDNIKFTITLDNVKCTNSSTRFVASVVLRLIMLSLLYNIFR